MIETWKEILDGYYEVSDHGRVRRAKPGVHTYVGRLLTPYQTPQGYLWVTLSKPGYCRAFGIHRLVAQAFIGPRPKRQDVNHRDLDKTNNVPSNLEYVSRKTNVHHAMQNGVYYGRPNEQNGNARINFAIANKIREAYKIGNITQIELARKFNVSPYTVWCILANRRWTH